jgi:triphosphoribosyl-dephospho-CoA synthase
MSIAANTSAVERWIRTACLMEVTAPKPGNVYPGAGFADVCFDDFVRSADEVAPVLAGAAEFGVGRVMLEAVRATQQAVGRNTNLGIILLLAPLAAVPLRYSLPSGVRRVLGELTIRDARDCYAAIRLANPGGLGTAPDADVADEPEIGLVAAMTLAAGRDRVAAQYAGGFVDVLTTGLPLLAEVYDPHHWQHSVVRLHLELLARAPDTLIARKCGWEIAREASHRARQVLEAGWPDEPAGASAIHKFDAWLRCDGHRRNPGTTADLVAAILFAGLREGVIVTPPEFSG